MIDIKAHNELMIADLNLLKDMVSEGDVMGLIFVARNRDGSHTLGRNLGDVACMEWVGAMELMKHALIEEMGVTE